MIKREFKVNFKSFIVWSSILIILFLIVFLIYPYIITDDIMNNLDDMMKVFPEDLLKAFNMDITSINTAYGWLKSEGLMFVMLIIGFYSSSLGGSILLREESEKTIEYLACKPITRSKILLNKILVGITYIIGIVLLLGLFNYIALLIIEEFNQSEYLLLSITPILIGIPLFSINLFISTFFHKTKKNIMISLGMVFIFYVLNVLSELSTKVEFLKYFTIYTLADTRNIIESASINMMCIIISLLISIIFITLSFYRYNRKELL